MKEEKASNYHPKMLLKALLYGYIEKLYSLRSIRLKKKKIEKMNKNS